MVNHENDHLNGVLFIDKLSKANRKLAMKEIRESDWFSQASQAGINVSIKESPHSMFGRNT